MCSFGSAYVHLGQLTFRFADVDTTYSADPHFAIFLEAEELCNFVRDGKLQAAE